MKAATLKRTPPLPDRQALIDAFAGLAEARGALDRHEKATRGYWAALREREAAVKRAEKGVADAKFAHGAVLAGAAMADEDDPPAAGDMTRLARQSLQDARDALEATQAARDSIKFDLPELEANLRFAVANVRAEAARILVPHMQALLGQAREAWKALEPLKQMLEQAAVEERPVDGVWGGTWQGIVAAGRVAKPLQEIRSETESFLRQCSTRDYRPGGPNLFHAALARLEQDPLADISDLAALPASPPPSAA
jgi:hypothetical protein